MSLDCLYKIPANNVENKVLSILCAFILLSSGGMLTPIVWAEDDMIGTIPGQTIDAAANSLTNKIYATSSSGLIVIDGSTNTVENTIVVGQNPIGVDVNPVTNKVYVVNSGDGTVSVVDGTNNLVTANIPTGPYPFDVVVNPVTNMIYVADNSAGTVTVIDGATDSIVTTISLESGVSAVDVNPVTNTIYAVCNCQSGHVAVIDGLTNTVSAMIVVARFLPSHYVAVNPDTNKVYVTFRYGVAVIDGQTNAILKYTGSCPNASYGIDLNPNTNKVYVGCTSSEPLVSVIDGSTDIPKYNIPLSGFVWGIGVNTNTNRIYIATSNNLTVLDGSVSTTSQLTVDSQDSSVNTISGYYAALFQNDVLIDSGFTPVSFTLNSGETYTVHVDDYGKYVFDHWLDTGDTSADRTISITSDYTITAVFKTVPQPPTDLSANAASSSQIDLLWSVPSDDGGSAIMGYMIERSSDEGSTWSTIVDNTGFTDTTYSDTGLSPNTTYTYRVSAINSVGTSDPSDTASATTPLASLAGIRVGPLPIPISILP